AAGIATGSACLTAVNPLHDDVSNPIRSGAGGVPHEVRGVRSACEDSAACEMAGPLDEPTRHSKPGEVGLNLELAHAAPLEGGLSTADAEGSAAISVPRVHKILVVDDETPVRSMIGATLERQGYHVQLAGSGREACETLERQPVDLVLTDIVMQDGNGIALLERVRANYPNIPVVMVSAIHDISVAIDSMRRGADDYRLKPFEREHLVATVGRALEYRQALEENQNYQLSLEQVVQARTELLQQAMQDLEHSYDITL